MLANSSHLKGFVIQATDGELGTVEHFYFDDESWAIRYLVVDAGGWLGGRGSSRLANLYRQYGLASGTNRCGADEEES